MHFMVTGYDGSDEGAAARRQAARPAHLEYAAKLTAQGQLPYAFALLSDDAEKKMVGSVMILNLPSRTEVDQYLAAEPYVQQKVWVRMEIRPVQPGPAFLPAAP
jgi:uncharacterized protein YciI